MIGNKGSALGIAIEDLVQARGQPADQNERRIRRLLWLSPAEYLVLHQLHGIVDLVDCQGCDQATIAQREDLRGADGVLIEVVRELGLPLKLG